MGASPVLGVSPLSSITTMKKLIITITTIIILVIQVIFLAPKVSAVEMTFYSCDDYHNTYACCFGSGNFYQKFIATTNNITKIKAQYWGNESSDNYIIIYDSEDNPLSESNHLPNVSGNVFYNFPAPVELIIGSQYKVIYYGSRPNYGFYGCSSQTNLIFGHTQGWESSTWGDVLEGAYYYDDEYIPAVDFAITSPEMNEIKIEESWITVSGNCPTNGSNRIALTNDCSDFSNLDYTVDCVDNQFSADFYYNGISDWVIAVEKDSIAGDCVDYDDLMDVVEIDGIEVIEGYPDEWYFNYNYYDDFDIEIVSPIFDMPALTLPLGSTNVDMTFSFVYPHPLSPNLSFNMKQYDENGNLLNSTYHTKALYEMADTNNYTVNLNASSTAIHYVVQLLNNGELVRQYPFGVFVSDLDLIINPDDYRYLFPRLVEKLKDKVVFNYYFAFYDGFYGLFNGDMNDVESDDLDITFKSVSSNGEYNLDIPVFKGSNPAVKSFADGLRPYIVGLLWLGFALYVVVRVNSLFGKEE